MPGVAGAHGGADEWVGRVCRKETGRQIGPEGCEHSSEQPLQGLRSANRIKCIFILLKKNYFFWLHLVVCETLVPHPGIKSAPPLLESGALTVGLLGQSLGLYFKCSLCVGQVESGGRRGSRGRPRSKEAGQLSRGG